MTFRDRMARFGLAQRAMALVTIALLPLGVIATWQTHQIIQDQRATAEQALLAVTEKAAARERRLIERAIGAAAAMGNTAHSLANSPELCRSILTQVEQGSALYSFLGFSPAFGSMGCYSSSQQTISVGERFAALIAEERTGLFVNRDPKAPENGILIVATPAFDNGTYAGHLQLHIPQSAFETSEPMGETTPLGLVTFNHMGDILTSESRLEKARGLLPNGVELDTLISANPYTFTKISENGTERTYAFVPLVAGTAYALGTWSSDAELLQSEDSYWRTILLAVLMWLSSLMVIFLIMQLLVIRGVQKLKMQVRRFRDAREIPTADTSAQGELFDLEEDFRAMTETILREEAQLEDAVQEKNVLLKEVHHRVKNNLQLINSIINMILRGSASTETRTVVRRLQDRVMALASVHRSIYQAQSLDRVDAAEIVREIVNQGVAIGLPRGSDVDVRLDLKSVSLYPDQAMPLSLLVSEAITNALKYIGGDAPYICVELYDHPDSAGSDTNMATLRVINTVGDTVEDEEGTGLGAQLLRAFTRQLEGVFTTVRENDLHVLSITFAIAQFDPEDNTLSEAAE